MASSVLAAEAGKARRRRKNQESGARIFIKYQPRKPRISYLYRGPILVKP
jgi:hypothetical protein